MAALVQTSVSAYIAHTYAWEYHSGGLFQNKESSPSRQILPLTFEAIKW